MRIVSRGLPIVESRGVPAERILALTFSSKAAGDDATSGLLATLPGGYGSLWAHTFDFVLFAHPARARSARGSAPLRGRSGGRC